jgi:hypothetical protein
MMRKTAMYGRQETYIRTSDVIHVGAQRKICTLTHINTPMFDTAIPLFISSFNC